MPLLLFVLLLLCGHPASARTVHAVAPPLETVQVQQQPSAEAKHVSVDQYLATLKQQSGLLTSCRLSAAGCDPARVGDDLKVNRNGPSFHAGFGWLRLSLRDARRANDVERARLMDEAATRLQEDAAEMDAAATPEVSVPEAQTRVNNILNRTEFRVAAPDNWLLRQWQKLLARIAEALQRAASHVPHSSSLVLVIEWGLLSLAAAGLLLWAWRSMRRQRLTVSVAPEAGQAVWQKESDDWARLSEVEAAAGRWRDAVHCLYWAAIVMLEGQRLWRSNRARTPREYLPLLESGSVRQIALGRLTRIFERVWYGLQPADRADFERAQALVNQLKAA